MEAADVSAQEFAEGGVFQLGRRDAVGGVDVGGHVAVSVGAGEMEIGDLAAGNLGGPEQAAHAASAAHGAAQVGAPGVGAVENRGLRVERVDDSDEVPAVVEIFLVQNGRGGVIGAVPDALLNATALKIIVKLDELRAARILGHQFGEAVFAVPSVGPSAISSEIAVKIMGEHLGRRGHEHIPALGGRDVVIARAMDRRQAPDRRQAVVNGDFLAEKAAVPIGRLGVDRDGGRGERRADHIEPSGHRAIDILVVGIGRVGRNAKVRAVLVAAGLGDCAIANFVKHIFKLLASDGHGVGPRALARGDLPQGVVIVVPMAVVRQRNFGALIGVVIQVAVGIERRSRRVERNLKLNLSAV